MTTIPLTIATAFLAEIATRYQMPELATAKFEPATRQRFIEGTLTAVATVAPTGQMAALVRTLEVTVSVSPHYLPGMFQGKVELSYGHFNGGSNGHDTDFIIVTQTRYGSSIEYCGALEGSAFRTAADALMRHAESVAAQA